MNTLIKYLRISNEDIGKGKDAESVSIVNQRHLLDDYLDTHKEFDGWNRLELCDDGWSGTNFERPGMKELLEHVRKGRIQCIIVKDFSRFGRNYLEVGDYITRVFPFMGVRFISLGDGYDSSRPADIDSLSVSFSTIIYDLYSKELSEKVRLAKDRVAASGAFLAPEAPFGYAKDPTMSKHLVIDTDAAIIVKTIFDMVCDGKSVVEIARYLNHTEALTPMRYKRSIGCKWLPWPCISPDNYWNTSNVIRIIRDERYTGCNIYGKRRRDIVGSTHTVKAGRDKWIITENTHEAIISEEQFEEAQKNLRKFQERTGTVTTRPLARKVYCGCCGRALRRISSKGTYYICQTSRFTDQYDCCEKRIPEADIIEAVLTTVQAYSRLAVDLDALLYQKQEQLRVDRKQLQRKLMVLQNRKEQTEQRLQDMYELFIEGEIEKSEYLNRKQNLTGQLSNLAEETETLETALGKEQDEESKHIINTFKSYAGIDDISAVNLREILSRITVFPDGVLHVKLNFCDELESIANELHTERSPA